MPSTSQSLSGGCWRTRNEAHEHIRRHLDVPLLQDRERHAVLREVRRPQMHRGREAAMNWLLQGQTWVSIAHVRTQGDAVVMAALPDLEAAAERLYSSSLSDGKERMDAWDGLKTAIRQGERRAMTQGFPTCAVRDCEAQAKRRCVHGHLICRAHAATYYNAYDVSCSRCREDFWPGVDSTRKKAKE